MKCLILYILIAVHEATSYTKDKKCRVQDDNVDCSHLDLTTIPRHLPVNATSLNLFWNRIKIVKGFTFQSMRYITYLDLGRNVIELIEINAFYGLHRLRTLHLHDNAINVFPDGMFERLNGLQVLSIDGNKLKYFQDDRITKVSKIVSLTTLSFDVYPDFKFPSQWGTLSKLTDLRIFAMSAKVKFNKAMFVHVNMMQTTSLSINVVPFISEDFFEHFPKLESITLSIGSDLPNNPIDQVFKSLGIFRGKNISNLEIRSGRFDNGFILNYKRMRYLWSICLKRLTLNNLYIKDILMYAMQVFSIKSTCLEYLEFSENIMFDRGAAVVAVMNNLKNLKVLKITRNWRNSRRKRSQPSKLYNFVLPKTLEELYIEHNMDGDMADVEVVNGFNLRVLSLKDNEMWSCIGTFTGIINVEYFDMSGWRCEKLSVNLLYGFPNLMTLKASGSHLGKGFVKLAGAGSFLSKNLKLQDINLSSNRMNSIPKGLFLRPFEQLSLVNMSYNNLTIFPKFHASIKTLKIIDLTFNSITHLNNKDIEGIEKLGEVDILLRGNPFQCSCKTLQFLKWLSETNRVQDILHLTCVTENASSRFMSELMSNLKTFEISCKTKFWLPFAVSITSIIILAIITTVVFFRYKYMYAVEYFLLRFKMKLRNYEELTQDYPHDAFISYSHSDLEWVKDFHDNLKSMGFKLCLDAKDFIAGCGKAENVLNAIDSSRKVIFIITHNFLKSSWGSYEMEMTRMHAFQKGREDMVIVVVKDDIKITDMPEVMKNMWFKTTCIQWPNDDNLPYNTEEIFYEKIKMALTKKEETFIYSRNSVI